MKRLLCLISCMNTGGAETFLMKLYRQLDKSKYQMDFCVNICDKGFYDDEIRALGGRIYNIPSKSENVREFKKQLTKVVKEGHYETVLRITSSAAGFLDLKIAKKAGASRCCARSSNSSDGSSMMSRIAHQMGRLLYGKYVDCKIAPSDLAAKYTFGEKAYRNGEVQILHNAIDLSIYRYDPTARIQLRQELGIADDALVIGHVGRFDRQKNHTFLIDIFAEISRKEENARLLLVGKGPLQDQIREKVHKIGLDDKVIFTGVRPDVPRLLSAMDVMVFPSFYEGMPNVVVEAQATGLPCVISDTITREADITGIVKYLSLSEDADVWAEAAVSKAGIVRTNRTEQFISAKYDIQSVADEFINLTMGE